MGAHCRDVAKSIDVGRRESALAAFAAGFEQDDGRAVPIGWRRAEPMSLAVTEVCALVAQRLGTTP